MPATPPLQAHVTVLETSDADNNPGYFSCMAVLTAEPSVTDESCSVDWAALNDDSVSPVATYHLDSASTCHLMPDRQDFCSFTSIPPRTIRGINGSSTYASGIGNVCLRLGKGCVLIMCDVLHVPNATLCLISVGCLCDKGYTVTFDSMTSCSVSQGSGASKLIATRTCHSGALYTLNGAPSPPSESACLTKAAPSLETWHCRLGHVNMDSIIHMARHGLVLGMPIDLSVCPPSCEHCIVRKQAKMNLPCTREGRRATHLMGIVFANLMGPVKPESLGKKSYSLKLIDDFSAMSFVFLLRHKSEAVSSFRTWRASAEQSSGQPLGIFCTDNGGKFTADEFEAYLAAKGSAVQL
ncbi:hypothetical protein EWM64_g7155 [Hericium alpestre]|uniref:Integrase catalytic domain-containing protein n=1 Tax=Hericium alpestre TaxID=135208 RepID=A0A4Y9ZPM6_9AGAM|nr:hypothetical protein EWM64_g7155 [Hericium alpestre]